MVCKQFTRLSRTRESERLCHGYRGSRPARDCLDFIDHLGLQDVVLLGHSAGCNVIWSFLDFFGSERVRLVFVN